MQRVRRATLGKGSPWDAGTKVSDDSLFQDFLKSLGLPNLMRKTD